MHSPVPEPARANILVVEDSSVFREMQGLLLETAGFAVSAHEDPHSALAAAAQQRFDLVLIDYELPHMNGHQFMHALRAIQPEIAVVFVSGALTLDLAIQLSGEGVAGIFNKPANPKTLLEKINETLFGQAARDTAVRGRSASPLQDGRRETPVYVPPEPPADQLAYPPQFVVGSSDVFCEFTHRLWKVRDFRAVLLLQGEPGSPFELLARELANISMFRDGPVMVCTAADFDARRLIATLAPSLLSHDAGTLIVTGVEKFSVAQQKTLEDLITGRDVFLPFARRFRTVLAATPELSNRVDNATFNETLFYKISALSLPVPALREMAGDVTANAAHILAQIAAETNAATPLTLTPEAAAMLESGPWPGNYAELEHLLRTAVTHAAGGTIDVATLHGRGATDAIPESDTSAPFAGAGGGTKSFFRPESASYPFGQRLAEVLAAAGGLGLAS